MEHVARMAKVTSAEKDLVGALERKRKLRSANSNLSVSTQRFAQSLCI
jgi:hypothetical protein